MQLPDELEETGGKLFSLTSSAPNRPAEGPGRPGRPVWRAPGSNIRCYLSPSDCQQQQHSFLLLHSLLYSKDPAP
jgi:hypothetical protein